MAKPESKIEALYLVDIEEAPYLKGGQRLAADAKARIVRARRRHARKLEQESLAQEASASGS